MGLNQELEYFMEDIEVERICRTTNTSDEAIKYRLRACREATGLSIGELASSMSLYPSEFKAQERLDPHCRDLARHYHSVFHFPFDFIYGGETEIIAATLKKEGEQGDDGESDKVDPFHAALREALLGSSRS